MRTARTDFEARMCCTCKYFTLKGQPGEKEGRGLCTMYGRAEVWDWARCVIYTPATTTMGDRLREMEVLQREAAERLQKESDGTDKKS